MGWNCGHKGRQRPEVIKLLPMAKWSRCGLLDLYVDGLGFCVSGCILNGQSVSGVFFGGHLHAAGIGRPHGIVLRLKLDGFGVGDAIAELKRLATSDQAGAGVKTLDGEFLASKLLNSLAILSELF